MSPLPKITVVTPSYNQGKFLEATILSVLGQGYPNLEYIIIDGGSNDGSIEIIRKYERQLAFWVSEPDGGLYDAVQKGFARSSGDIMAWINADDLYHGRSLSLVADIFRRFGQVKWLMGINTFFDEAGHPFIYDDLPYGQRWSRERLLLFDGRFVQQESVFWRRELWEKAGARIDQQHSLAADFELWLRFSRYERLYTTSFMLGGFRFRSENQKSYEQRGEYLAQVMALMAAEKRHYRGNLALTRMLIALAKLVPKRRWRDKMLAWALNLPPRIEFDRAEGLVLNGQS